MKRALWLTPRTTSAAMKSLMETMMRRANLKPLDFFYGCGILTVEKPLEYKKVNTDKPQPYRLREGSKEKICGYVDRMLLTSRAEVIVCNDLATLWALCDVTHTLYLARGSVYRYKDIPVIVLDDFSLIPKIKHGPWLFQQDLQKVKRWLNSEQRAEPAFDYTLIETLDQFDEFYEWAMAGEVISEDIETKGRMITCIGFTILKGIELKTWTLPFYNPLKEEGAHWTEKQEIYIWQQLKDLNANDAIKIFQNGTYDCAYLVKYGIPPRNYILDTSNLIHSIWTELPKKLNFLASIFVDNCRYWKDESKGEKEEREGHNVSAIHRYWRYCGLDTYYTFLIGRQLTNGIVALPWARDNYRTEIKLSLGPCFAMSMRGMRINSERHRWKMDKAHAEWMKANDDWKEMVDDPTFNINSSDQLASFFYDVLGAQPTRMQWTDPKNKKGKKHGPRSINKDVLKIIQYQHPLFKRYIEQVKKVKEPGGIISDYGKMVWGAINDRYLYNLNAAGTETGRCSSGGHQFWTGGNSQNMPKSFRDVLVADPNYIILDIDYRASDDRFVAYEANDPDKIAVVEGSRDTHCVHAAHFFKLDYEHIFKGWKAKDPAIVHPITGIRNITKRVGHGKNFRMQEVTLFNTMGRDAVVTAAGLLGFESPGLLEDRELIQICKRLSDDYDHPTHGLYKRLRPWQDHTVAACVANGNRATCSGGRTRYFFGDVAHDPGIQRELSAYYGQGGTGGNINRATLKIFFMGIDDGRRCLLINQVHDSLVFLIHKDHLHLINIILTIMEEEIEINGQKVRIPTDPEVGLSWGEDMLSWNRDGSISYKDIVSHEKQKVAKKYELKQAALT